MKKTKWVYPVGSEVEVVVGTNRVVATGYVIRAISDRHSIPYNYKILTKSGEVISVKPSNLRRKKNDNIEAYDRAMAGI